MLRTPSAIEGDGGAITEDQARAKNRMLQVRDQMAQLAAENGLKVSPGIANSLLPTPNTMEHREVKTPEQIAELKKRSPGGYRNMREVVINELLPTPFARDYKDGYSDWKREGKVQTDTVAREIFSGGEITATAWGKFAPAIERWEQITGRAAPAPTKPDGNDGAHRLSSEFTEWMMGLPSGWITGVGLTRKDELKACGNGVVPQQAELALRILLNGMIIDGEDENE
jgi:DNA (cytosine-5)-methyltransferase 1